jgi:hypothetical protein
MGRENGGPAGTERALRKPDRGVRGISFWCAGICVGQGTQWRGRGTGSGLGTGGVCL